MKQRKNTVLLALLTLLLTSLCFFTACDDAPEVGEKTLDDFVYLIEIDTEHVITKKELDVMNRIWRKEFGKDLGDTPKDAMKRKTGGDFYFGRYGKTFVFYKYWLDYNTVVTIGEYEFELPLGRLYFVNSDRVYDQEEIAKTDVLTDRQLKSFYNCYQNTYLNYKPIITLEKGDYVLTEEDLAMMHSVYGSSDKFTGIDTLENAMQRRKDNAYYFGKYGDTVVIWSTMFHYNCPKFTLGGYEFDFYKGSVLFCEPSGAYRPDDPNIENIMTAEEKTAFYEHYTERYLPFVTLPYTCLEFTPELEKLTEDEMRSIDEAYTEWKYTREYNRYYKIYIDAKYTPENAAARADNAARNRLGADPHRFFNEEQFKYYQYLGKVGSKVFLVTQDTYNFLTITEIAGCKFVLDGNGEVLLFEDGEITLLSEAYENGLVTKSDVKFVQKRFLGYSATLDGKEDVPPPARLKIKAPREDVPIELTDAEQREIVWEYIADSSRIEEDLASIYTVRCYGKFGGAYAVMIDGPWGYFTAMTSETAAGYTFVFPSSQMIHIYKDGVFYGIQKAYELGVISERNVGSIRWKNVVKPYTFEKVSAPVDLGEQVIADFINSYVDDGASHEKGAVYSLRCYGEAERGYVVFVDRSDKTYEKVKTVENVGGYEFIYPTEQTLIFCYNYGGTLSLGEAFERSNLTEDELKEIYNTYRESHPELYK